MGKSEKRKSFKIELLDYKLTRFGTALLLVLCVCLALTSLAMTYLFPLTNYEHPYNSIKATLVAFPIACALSVLIGLIVKFAERASWKRVAYICAGVVFFIALVWSIIYSVFAPVADQWTVVESARLLSIGDFASLNASGVLKWYPFQSGYTLWAELIGSLFGFGNWTAFRLLGIISCPIIILSVAKTTHLLFGKETVTKVTVILLAAFLPLSLYSTFIYGTLPSLAASLIALYFQSLTIRNQRATVSKQLQWGLLSSLFFFIAIWFKPNSLIFLIGAEVVWLFMGLAHKRGLYALFIVLNLFAYLAANSIPVAIISSRGDIELGKGVPKTAWIVMGMQESPRAAGWYNGYVSNYWDEASEGSEESYNAANQKALADLHARINEMLANPLDALAFYGEKIATQWAEPTFQSIWCTYTGTGTVSEDGQLAGVSSQYDNDSFLQREVLKGKINKLLVVYCDALQSTIYLFTCLGLFGAMKSRLSLYRMVYGVVFLGGFIFHVIWEAKSCYTMPYFILLIPFAALGLGYIVDRRNKRLRHATKDA